MGHQAEANQDPVLPSIGPSEALALIRSGGARLVDVRREPARAASGAAPAGAERVSPEALHLGHGLFGGDAPLIFACVHGHEVSWYATAMGLVAGADARYVRGGMEALARAGAPMEPLGDRAEGGAA